MRGDVFGEESVDGRLEVEGSWGREHDTSQAWSTRQGRFLTRAPVELLFSPVDGVAWRANENSVSLTFNYFKNFGILLVGVRGRPREVTTEPSLGFVEFVVHLRRTPRYPEPVSAIRCA